MHDRLVDTSGWAAWADRSEIHHARAVEVCDETWNRGGVLVTTNYVLAELTALLPSPLRVPKAQQIELLRDLRADPSVAMVVLDARLDAAAWQLWDERPDKDWTFVDCASFVVMHDRGLLEAVTSDHHFEQAGFIRLHK